MLIFQRVILILWLGSLCHVCVSGHTIRTISISLGGDESQDDSTANQIPTSVGNATQLAELVQTQQTMIHQLLGIVNNVSQSVGTNYIRWGRKNCSTSATKLYDGYAAKSYYNQAGGGANYVCLHNEPEWPAGVTSGVQTNSYIYGVEYEPNDLFNLNDHDAPCAVCVVHGRGQHIMIPGRKTCDDGWTKEYSGFLVAERYVHTKSTFVCLDENPEADDGGSENKNGGLFYTVEARCGSLPCPPYVEGNELTCVVCTQ